MRHDQPIVFVKGPRPGAVKTRLAKSIGPEAACEAYRAMVEVLLRNLASLQHVQLRYAPDDALPEITRWLKPTWSAAPQGSGDLGDRLTRTVADAFGSGTERLVIIGSDCPDVDTTDIQTAWEALDTHDLVFGPAEDGGYYLLGLRAMHIDLFENIPWSSNAVLEITLARAASLNLKVHLLRQLHDIDTIEDLRRFQSRSAQQ